LTAVVLGQPDCQPVHVGLPDGVAIEAERPDPSTWSGMCTAAGLSWMIFVGDVVDHGPDTPGRDGQVMGMVGAGGGLCGTGRYEAKLVRALSRPERRSATACRRAGRLHVYQTGVRAGPALVPTRLAITSAPGEGGETTDQLRTTTAELNALQ
jgi:hypothetical protein